MGDRLAVLGIYGSPRKGGNTDLLIEEALRGAEAAGARVERVRLAEMRIIPCRECLSCYRDGNCVIADDMQGLYKRLLEADRIILASPIFFYGITAWAKAMVDRCQALWARRYILKDETPLNREGRRGLFISVSGTKGKRSFEGAVLTVRYFFDAFGVAYADDLLVRGIDACGDILKEPEALRQAFDAGKGLVAGGADPKI